MFGLGLLQTSAIGALLLAVVGGGSYFIGYERGHYQAIIDAEKAKTAAVTEAALNARALGIAEGTITITAGKHFAEVQEKVVTRTITRIQNIDHYIPMEVSTSCVIPLSVIQLLNAAAADSDDPTTAFPIPAGSVASDTASTNFAALISNVVENYGKHSQLRAQLIELQTWFAKQAELHDKMHD